MAVGRVTSKADNRQLELLTVDRVTSKADKEQLELLTVDRVTSKADKRQLGSVESSSSNIALRPRRP